MGVPPFLPSGEGQAVDIGLLHFHSLCFEKEIENSRKAVVSHKFIAEGDTKEIADAKFRQMYGDVNPCNSTEAAAIQGNSWHKSLQFWQYLRGCLDSTEYYRERSSNFSTRNSDFVHFLQQTRDEITDF